MESLSFSRNEMAAIIRLAFQMSAADGHADENEAKMIKTEMLRFGMSVTEMQNLCMFANNMNLQEVIRLVKLMNFEQKKYVTAYLGTLIVIDGDKDDKELALWRLVTDLCDLPEMTIAEAAHYMANL